jgi:hypothetical protein
MRETITKLLYFEQENCCSCGITFFVPQSFQQEALKRKRAFFCPNGHSQSYTTCEADSLRKELAAARQREETIKAQRDEANRLASLQTDLRRSAEGSLKRFKKRVAAGVCPCCHRTVSQMARHMKTKHPEFQANRGGVGCTTKKP